MKPLSFCLLLLSFNSVFSQKLEFNGGVLHNNFYGGRTEGHAYQEYKPGGNYCFSFFYDDVKIDSLKLKFKFGLTYSNYSGYLLTRDGGMGGSNTTSKTVTLNTLSLVFYPLNFRVFKHLRIDFGLQVSMLLSLKQQGYTSSWQMGQPSTHIDFDEKRLASMANKSFGITNRIAYEFQLNDNWMIIPQVNFYLDSPPFKLSNEVKVHSFRQSFNVGISRKLK
jgi:hypothetical protein